MPVLEPRSRPAAGMLNALVISAGFYGLLGGVIVVGGGRALFACLVVLLALLHGCLTDPARTVTGPEGRPVTSGRSAAR